MSDDHPIFTIIADETEITVEFPEPVTGNVLDQVGFRLINIESTEDLSVGTISDLCAPGQDYCVEFLNWNDPPDTRPEITIDGAGVQTLEWTAFTDGEAETGSVIVIRPLPEPSAAVLATAAVATLGLIRLAARRRRPRPARA